MTREHILTEKESRRRDDVCVPVAFTIAPLFARWLSPARVTAFTGK